MKNLIKAEWFKLSKSFGFKVLLLCNAASLFSTGILLALGFSGVKGIGYQLFVGTMKYVLHHTLIGNLFAAVFLCSEFAGSTFRMSLLCGYSRRKIFMAKALIFLAGLLLLFLVYVGITTVVVSVGNGGFGTPFNIETCRGVFVLICYGMAGCAAMGAVMVLTAVAVKKPFITVGAGMVTMYVLCQTENLTRENPLPCLKYFYTYQIRHLKFPGEGFSPGMFLAVIAGTFILAMAASIIIFERAEL